MFRIHSERCEDLNPNQQKEDTKRLLNGLQLMDSSMMSVKITRKRLLIVLIKLGLVSPDIETDGQISRSMAENILEKNVVCDDLLSCLLYTSPSPRDVEESRMPSSA